MHQLRVLCRVVTYDFSKDSILLVRNHAQKWWCAPGGGWDYGNETIIECAERETLEETGLRVKVTKFLFVQTLFIKAQNSTWLEHFWLAEPIGNTEFPKGHKDTYGTVNEAHWFRESELRNLRAYPEVLRQKIWESIKKISQEESSYLGHFEI